ncbi:MAG TPA: hypothetical protein PLE99_16090 [Candidatus Thiothrix moscowensis]|uniref:hypothetical protein n=1 Tax=unclassified Thiothrix TaxID=2636184 RepID=UPI0025E9F7BD|nr:MULTISPECIES: hypothetical protein [unclassified Thiothrix]HRJ54281.1 hypothetical protein [Candidatus Thiothrix moscowensis]HRJ94531.1 hypothetical protein [Candidatus Thiothrix moscowensis]
MIARISMFMVQMVKAWQLLSIKGTNMIFYEKCNCDDEILKDRDDVICLFYHRGRGSDFKYDQGGFEYREHLQLVKDAVLLTDQDVIFINEKNAFRSKGKEGYTILSHNISGEFSSELEGIMEFLRKRMISQKRVQRGLSPIDLEEPSFYKKWLSVNSIDEQVDLLVEYCEFVSVEPSFGGIYGSHFLIASRNIENVIQYTIPRLLGVPDHSIELLDQG